MKRFFAGKVQGVLLICLITLPLITNGCKREPLIPPPWEPNDEWPIYVYFDPAWSPDGNLIAYVWTGTPHPYTDTIGIFIFDIRDSTSSLLIGGLHRETPVHQMPDWSPCGEWIVLGAGARIWKIKVDGTGLTQLTSGRETFRPSWSPDGRKIAYNQPISTETHPRGIWIMDADGTNDHLIIRYARTPDWSPNGTKLVYSSFEGGPGHSQIWISDTSGGNKSQLTFFNITNASPAWSPDGSKIAFSSAGDGEGPRIWIMDADGSNPKKLTIGDQADWSPDGSKIVYTNTRLGEIWVMNPDGSEKRKLIGDVEENIKVMSNRI